MNKIITVLVLIILLFACKRDKTKNTNTYYSGTTTMYVDIQLKYLIDQIITSFENVYKKTTINIVYKNEEELIKQYLYDSLSNIIISRAIDSVEMQFHNQHSTTNGKQMIFAYDALAFLISKNTTVHSFDLNKMNNFNYVFFTNSKSGVPQKMLDLTKDTAIINKAAVVEDVDQLISNLDKYQNSIAIINYSAFSNQYDKKHLARREKVKILPIQYNDSIVELNQYNIAYQLYPNEYQKQLTVAFNESVDPLVKGVINFMFKERVAKICLHSGLVPHAIPELQVKLVTE